MKHKIPLPLFPLLVSAACGSEGGSSQPAPTPVSHDADTAEDAATPPPTPPPPDAAPSSRDAEIVPRRTIIHRDPFGNYAETGNLMFDGDFEWAGPMAMQYPWFTWPSGGGLRPPKMLRGPNCRSGMTCAFVNSGVAGIGVKPAQSQEAVTVSVWLRAAYGDQCPSATISLEGCFLHTESQALPDTAEGPDEEGWCRRFGVLTVPNDTPCVFVSTGGSFGTVIVDDVVMKAAPLGTKLRRAVHYPESHRKIVHELREAAREAGHPPPTSVLPPPFARKLR
ncbi:MAG: hypothetical protein ACOC1F_05045 [Myxococcota bacterium]